MQHADDVIKQKGHPKATLSCAQALAPHSGPIHPVLQLQQRVGNQAVQDLLRSGFIQAKLATSNPSDPEEREADRVADHIMRASEGQVFGAPRPNIISGQDTCDERRQEPPTIHRQAAGTAAPKVVPRIVGEDLHTGGHPLDTASRVYFERRFGQDFTDVRVHTGGEAARSARAINARAYATCNHIVFDAGQYAPESPTGRHLIAHELTHVVQQQKTYHSRSALIQRAPLDAEPVGPIGVPYKGQLFTADPIQLRSLLERLVAERGQSETETIAYGLLGITFEEKIALQLRGIDPGLLSAVQTALKPVLQKLQQDRADYLDKFQEDAANATLALLEASMKELQKEELKYTDTPPAQTPPDLVGLRAAAKELASKRRAADTAAEKAKAANTSMIEGKIPKFILVHPSYLSRAFPTFRIPACVSRQARLQRLGGSWNRNTEVFELAKRRASPLLPCSLGTKITVPQIDSNH